MNVAMLSPCTLVKTKHFDEKELGFPSVLHKEEPILLVTCVQWSDYSLITWEWSHPTASPYLGLYNIHVHTTTAISPTPLTQ